MYPPARMITWPRLRRLASIEGLNPFFFYPAFPSFPSPKRPHDYRLLRDGVLATRLFFFSPPPDLFFSLLSFSFSLRASLMAGNLSSPRQTYPFSGPSRIYSPGGSGACVITTTSLIRVDRPAGPWSSPPPTSLSSLAKLAKDRVYDRVLLGGLLPNPDWHFGMPVFCCCSYGPIPA